MRKRAEIAADGVPPSPRRGKGEPLSLRVRAMRMLARREYSRAELRARLLPHMQEGEDVEAVLDDLETRNWLSDARAAELIVNTRRTRFGAQRIAHEMRKKGLADELIGKALPGLKASEQDAAREVWQRKFGTLPHSAQEKARQVRFMQSRGFALDVIFKVLQNGDLLD